MLFNLENVVKCRVPGHRVRQRLVSWCSGVLESEILLSRVCPTNEVRSERGHAVHTCHVDYRRLLTFKDGSR